MAFLLSEQNDVMKFNRVVMDFSTAHPLQFQTYITAAGNKLPAKFGKLSQIWQSCGTLFRV